MSERLSLDRQSFLAISICGKISMFVFSKLTFEVNWICTHLINVCAIIIRMLNQNSFFELASLLAGLCYLRILCVTKLQQQQKLFHFCCSWHIYLMHIFDLETVCEQVISGQGAIHTNDRKKTNVNK